MSNTSTYQRSDGPRTVVKCTLAVFRPCVKSTVKIWRPPSPRARLGDGRLVVPQALELDQELPLDDGTVRVVAQRTFVVPEDGADGLDVLCARAGDESVDGAAGRRPAGQRVVRDDDRPAGGHEHEHQGDSLHSRLRFGV